MEVLAEDALERVSITKTVPTNSLAELYLGDGVPPGYWKITATYLSQDKMSLDSSAIFMIETNEIVEFEIKDNILTIINTGNVKYTKTIQIVIGDTIGAKQLDLGIGESTSFRLIAPEGVYDIKVTDGKTVISQNNVALTGNVIGILDNQDKSRGPLTTEVNGETPEYGDDRPINIFKNNMIVYLFLITLFGAAILVAIERRLRAKALK